MDSSMMGGIGPVDERPAHGIDRVYVAGARVSKVVESSALVS